ncbi:hypothetical protein [Planctomycetes bacterium TBK1r]|uniref:Uncharacterized protein n=1 Tax=Stieleria magnilauensis TaxID=2527963 RepID=A0ABX5Y0A3_9BACT|nr:hypothetical protein TBK1r_61990 [Planctomycetes bacterium TBK1r]
MPKPSPELKKKRANANRKKKRKERREKASDARPDLTDAWRVLGLPAKMAEPHHTIFVDYWRNLERFELTLIKHGPASVKDLEALFGRTQKFVERAIATLFELGGPVVYATPMPGERGNKYSYASGGRAVFPDNQSLYESRVPDRRPS